MCIFFVDFFCEEEAKVIMEDLGECKREFAKKAYEGISSFGWVWNNKGNRGY